MYLSKLELNNFRKFKKLEVPFKDGLNVIIGENDSGKTAIIDSIRILLGTQSHEFYYIEEKDFNNPNLELEIECTFKFRTDDKVGRFVEWITFEGKQPILKVRLIASLNNFRIKKEIKAGEKGLDSRFDLYDELRTTYLKPLRDASNELIAKKRSRLSQILKNHKLFLGKEKEHIFIEKMKTFNKEINDYFSTENEGEEIIQALKKNLDGFLGKEKKEDYKTKINISEENLSSILTSLNLTLSENKVGLGTLNQLYIALELLLFESERDLSLNLCLIEEIEAHLHPQAQLRTIKHLQNKFKTGNQIILTTHSTVLGSSIKLENLILCKNNAVYPMGKSYTELADEDYKFLEIFLDVTKSNLFFAKGVIFVEGDAENVLIPTIAEIIGKPLYAHGVSVVNIGGTAFMRYSKIFLRKGEEKLDIPVAIITDLDVPENEYEGIILRKELIEKLNKILKTKEYSIDELKDTVYLNEDELKSGIKEFLNISRLPNGVKGIVEKFELEKININIYREKKRERKKKSYEKDNIKVFINKKQTLEYDISMSDLYDYFYDAVLLTKGEEDKKDLSSLSREKRAIEIFDNNFYTKKEENKKSNLSKATVALNFSKILLENRENVKSIILKDHYIEYIVKAIKYATGDE
ncbi:ATP-dependent nuclease [Fusobacterium sp. MFO224]|uniref:ATP-dependent nuclease n=1 Tax=Fusobacterium sp. MFO224 TaxID=3378070 RepID=UPI0038555837